MQYCPSEIHAQIEPLLGLKMLWTGITRHFVVVVVVKPRGCPLIVQYVMLMYQMVAW